MDPMGPNLRVAVLALGGTIGMSQTGSGGVSPTDSASRFLETLTVPGVDLALIPVVAKPSCELTFADVAGLATLIRVTFAPSHAGVVVLTGTDTLEEVAFALDLMRSPGTRIVVTGAMRSADAIGADGPANVLAAVRVAACRNAAEGVFVVMDDLIHTARYVRKVKTSGPGAFASPDLGPVGRVTEGRVRFTAQVASGPSFTPLAAAPRVALIRASFDEDGGLLDHVAAGGYGGLVIEGVGGGHLAQRMAARLDRLAKTMPVVLASRTGGGEVLTESYNYPGGEMDLIGRGLIPAGDLDGAKARVALMTLLSAGLGRDAIRRFFARSDGCHPSGFSKADWAQRRA